MPRLQQTLFHKNEKTGKFWSIYTTGKSYTINEGTPDKVKTSTKSFSTEEDCYAEATRLFSQKLKTGYKENTSPGSREMEAEENYNSNRKKDKRH